MSAIELLTSFFNTKNNGKMRQYLESKPRYEILDGLRGVAAMREGYRCSMHGFRIIQMHRLLRI